FWRSSPLAKSRRASRVMAAIRAASGSRVFTSALEAPPKRLRLRVPTRSHRHTWTPGAHARGAHAGRSGDVRLIPITRLLRWQQLGTNLILNLPSQLLIVLEEDPHIVLTLPDAITLVRVPGAGLVDNPLRAGELNDLAFARDTLPVHDLELGLAERWRHFVLYDLHPGHIACDFLAVLDRADAAHVETHRSVELQRVTAGRGIGASKHHADL